MAQQPSPSSGVDANDALNLASQAIASMPTGGTSRATAESLHRSLDPVSQNFLNQPAAPSVTPLPSPSTTAALSNHDTKQNDATKTAQPDVAACQSSHPSQQGGTHGEPEVKMPRANEQQDAKVPQKAESLDAGARCAGSEDEVISNLELSGEELSDAIESHVSLESEDDLDRLDKYAFNYAGQAYDHRVPQNLTGGTVLFTSKATQGTTILQVLESFDKQKENIVCPTLIPHALEMKRAPRKVECIWVGMALNPQSSQKHAASASAQPKSKASAVSPAAQSGGDDTAEAQLDGTSKASNKVQKRAKKGQPVVDLKQNQLDIIPHDPNALRVVAKKLSKAVKTWHLYALTMSGNSSKLCQGWKVQSEEVFLFKAFRDDTVAGFMKRRHASDLKIKAVIFPADPTPALLPQSSPSAKPSASSVSTPATSTPDGLTSPKPSGRKGKGRRTVRDATPKQAPEIEDVRDQDGDHAVSPVGSVEDDNGSDAESTAQLEPKDLGTPSLESDKPKLTATVAGDGDEEAYPEHAVSATNASYKNFVDDMIRQVAAVDSTNIRPGEKRKRVAFEPSCDEVASTRRKTDEGSRSNADARDGEERPESASFVAQQETDHLLSKLMSKVDKLVAMQDVAGLRQCITLVECIEKRGTPAQMSAFAPYLSITSKKDATTRACQGKLREILVGFPLGSIVPEK